MLDNKVIVLRTSRHLFGGVWSSSVANYAVKRTTDYNESDFDITTLETIRNNVHVDDCWRAVDTVAEEVHRVGEVQGLLFRRGFIIEK